MRKSAAIVGVSLAFSTAVAAGDPASFSKLSLHSGGGVETWRYLQKVKPPVLKLLDAVDQAMKVKALSPSTLVVGRIYSGSQPQGGDPGQRAQAWWQTNKAKILANPEVDFWEGYNEP